MPVPGIDHIGVSVAFYCHDGNGNFLLHRRSEKCRDEAGKWDVGGGQLEFGETPEQAVLREVREEYGVEGVLERMLPAYSLIRDNGGKKSHWIILTFFVRIDREKARNNDPGKITEMGWFRIGSFPEPLHPGPRYLLENHPSEFSGYGEPVKPA